MKGEEGRRRERKVEERKDEKKNGEVTKERYSEVGRARKGRVI